MDVRCVAVVAASADDELPELPAEPELPVGVQLVPVSRQSAFAARDQLARRQGLCVSHASAAAVACAQALAASEGRGPVVALISSAGEREFSLEPTALEVAS
jgi:cysteine synthase